MLGRQARAQMGTTVPHGSNRMLMRGYGANSAMNGMNGPILNQLRTAYTTLANANHDYQGHRARAMHYVGSAIHSITPSTLRSNQANLNGNLGQGNLTGNVGGNLNGKNLTATALNTPKGNAGNGNVNANVVPQTTSDAHLRTALQTLNTVQTQLANTGAARHHARTRISVQHAIQEINTALSIR
jgi:hypothetical protein